LTKKLIISLLIILFATPVGATDYYLSLGGNGSDPDGGWSTAANTIAQINALNPGNGSHTVYVRAGDTFTDDGLDLVSWSNSYTTISLHGSDGGGRTLAVDGNPVIEGDSNQAFDLNKSGVNWNIKDIKLNKGRNGAYMAHIQNSGSVTIDGLDADSSTGSTPWNQHVLYIRNFTGNVEVKNCIITGYFNSDDKSDDKHVLTVRQNDGSGTNHGNNIVSIYDNQLNSSHADLLMLYNLKSNAGYEVQVYRNIFTGWGENGIDNKGTQRSLIYLNEFYNQGNDRKNSVGLSAAIVINDGDALEIDSTYSNYVYAYLNKIVGNYDTSNSYYGGIASVPASGDYHYIYGNFIEDAVPGIALQGDDYLYAYSNIIHQETAISDVGSGWTRDKTLFQLYGGIQYVYVFNNSLYQDTDATGIEYGVYFHSDISNGDDIYLRNMLVYMTQTGKEALYISSGVTGSPTIDYNTWYNDENTTLIYDEGNTYTSSNFSSWAAGAHANDKNRQIDFIAKATGNLRLPGDSLELDSGYDEGSYQGLSSSQTDFSVSPLTPVLVDRVTYDRGGFEYDSNPHFMGVTID
jgi:hypothetical protein